MSPKKIHEATRLSAYIKSKSDLYNVHKSIDIGSGQGYLSHLLVTRGDMKVVAIEAKEHNCHESEKRGKIISEKLGHEGEFETIPMIVTKDNIAVFTREPTFLVGLHTCGDLSPICLKLFLADENIKGVINVGCCYHHLTEYVAPEAKDQVDEYLIRVRESFQGRSIDETLTENKDSGFPLSEYIKKKHPWFFLGRLPRTLSISEPQPSHVIDPSLTFRKFQYRAAFQALLQEYFPHYALTFAIGNRIKRFDCFGNYAEDAMKKMNLKSTFTKDELEGFYQERFKGLEKMSAIFWVMRSSLSGCIENLIILDRALFLAEQGAITEIMTIFDKHQSPRNIVISAFKP
ncbi:hypothetical protein SteCoe_33037 [Stentor coeruleus]|uniref:Methyltransferase domain-containing protein n=1 Tax=Stentor coeruleus TaxID=5963 RepID=A0A1R2AXN3_9CILI|nr:hypothetical protein SteCoe_33037 [Stentor coeruleus]